MTICSKAGQLREGRPEAVAHDGGVTGTVFAGVHDGLRGDPWRIATLRDLLKEHITDDADTTLNGVPVDLRSPRELEVAVITDALSVWLYRVVLQPDLVNQPGRRISLSETERRSTRLQLYYLITPMHTQPLTEHTLMGRAIQIVRDITPCSAGVS